MKKKLIPIFAHGTLEQIEAAIASRKLKYPAYIWLDDSDRYAFLNKNGELEKCGIPKLVGTLEDTVILSLLDDGLYQVKGQHKITVDDPTVYLSASYIMCIVQTIDGEKKVKRITADEIIDYTVKDNFSVIENSIVTEAYLEEKGYADTEYIDTKIEVMKQQIEEDMVPLLNPIVDVLLDEKTSNVGDEKIEELFE